LRDLKKLLKKNLSNSDKGTYILSLELSETRKITVGKLGSFIFKKGTYFYIGSARGGFRRRVIRYFEKARNKKWHIDYLLEYAYPKHIFLFDEFYSEERIAKRMSELYTPIIRGFGATDTHSKTHLFYKEEE